MYNRFTVKKEWQMTKCMYMNMIHVTDLKGRLPGQEGQSAGAD